MARNMDEFHQELDEVLRAKFALVHIQTVEEDRALRVVAKAAQNLNAKVILWSTSRGIFRLDEEITDKKPAPVPWMTKLKNTEQMTDLVGAIGTFEKICQQEKSEHTRHIFILLDPYQYLTDRNANPIYRRRLREFTIDLRTKGWSGTCIIMAPTSNIPLELEKEITVLDFPIPTKSEVRKHIAAFYDKIVTSNVVKIDPDRGLIDTLTDASTGLTMVEIDNALARAVVDDAKVDKTDVLKIFNQKRQIVRKNGIIDYIDNREFTLDDVGGLDKLKHWLYARDAVFSAEGRKFGIATPKGVLVTGISGCGKSWAARCVAASWNLPLVRLDMGKVYSSLVGSSEERMRDAIGTCESIAPCVLWIDEIEKSLPRVDGHIGDTGVSLRVLASFLTWMQERTTEVFVFATANEIELLPPETLRKGRFDEIFFVDLPTAKERREILEIHLRRIGRDPGTLDLARLVTLSGPDVLGDGIAYTGAELVSWINEALIRAFHRRKHGAAGADLSLEDFEALTAQLVPLARLRATDVTRMRHWAESHAIVASTQDE